MNEDLPGKLLASAYRYLSRRDHSRAELERKLTLRGFEPGQIRDVLNHLEGSGYINDLEFARGFVRYCQRIRRLGQRRIRQELESRGVGRQAIWEAMASYDQNLEEENLEHLAKKKILSGKDVNKVASYLVRRGFLPGDALGVARKAKENIFQQE